MRTGEESTLYSFSHWLIAAARAGQSKIQDAALEAMVAKAASEDAEGETQVWPEQYVSAIRHILDANSAGDVSTDLLSALLQGDNAPMGWCDASYFFSQLLEFRGFSEHAKTYRDYAISLNEDSRITWHLAAFDAHRFNRSEANATDATDPP